MLASSARDDAAPARLAAQCMKRRIKVRRHGPPPIFAALGFNFTGGEAFPRKGWWYEKEDQFLFEHFFSAGGRPPFTRDGTFVELGANDGGESDSTTLWFERALGWSGVLIEGTPATYKLLQRNRGGNVRNRLVNAVVCKEGTTVSYRVPQAAPGDQNRANYGCTAGIGASLPPVQLLWAPKVLELPCRSLTGILQGAGVSRVDLFSLDVEGAELTVLSTLDPAAIHIGLFMIEQSGKNATKDRMVRGLVQNWGYRLRAKIGVGCANETSLLAKSSRTTSRRWSRSTRSGRQRTPSSRPSADTSTTWEPSRSPRHAKGTSRTWRPLLTNPPTRHRWQTAHCSSTSRRSPTWTASASTRRTAS